MRCPRLTILAVILLPLLLFTGCTEAQIARAEAAASTAAQAVARAESVLADATQALSIAQAVAAATGNADAQAAVAKAQAAVSIATEAMPALQATAESAAKAAADARRGAQWWEIGLGILGTAAAALLPILRARGASATMLQVATSAVQVAEELKPLAEAGSPDRTRQVLDRARADQADKGIRATINNLRVIDGR